MINEFKAFIARGNVLDLAVAVIIGAAFGKIVTSLTDDIIMPIVGKLLGGLDFSSYFLVLGTVPAELAGSSDYAALKKAGVPLLGYGSFITVAVNFLIVAFIIFLLVRSINRLMPKPGETPAEPAAEPADIALLREIRDELKKAKAPAVAPAKAAVSAPAVVKAAPVAKAAPAKAPAKPAAKPKAPAKPATKPKA
jgi:large conductance mechanosensitive channel